MIEGQMVKLGEVRSYIWLIERKVLWARQDILLSLDHLLNDFIEFHVKFVSKRQKCFIRQVKSSTAQ